MPTVALISDIHANLEALQAVFDHIDQQPAIEKVVCLGDVCGYGPDPEGVIDLINKRCEFTLLGNHDHALLNQPLGFNAIAAGAIACQRTSMEPGAFSFPSKKFRWNWLRDLPEEETRGDDYFVHASPRDKIFEYILPEDAIRQPDKIAAIFDQVACRCYVGHTHRPGITTTDPRWYSEKDLGMEYEWKPGEKLLVNVSSVGQPRDRDPRACYAVITESGIRWHRVEYNIDETVRKVRDNPCLDNLCGERLLLGR